MVGLESEIALVVSLKARRCYGRGQERHEERNDTVITLHLLLNLSLLALANTLL